MKNLEQYFRECDKNRAIDHALRATVSKDRVKFYIHPINANGDTLDYEVKGDALIPLINGEKVEKADGLFSYKDLSALMGLVVKNSVELQAQLHDKNYESELEKESLERELQSINEVGAKISAQINKK